MYNGVLPGYQVNITAFIFEVTLTLEAGDQSGIVFGEIGYMKKGTAHRCQTGGRFYINLPTSQDNPDLTDIKIKEIVITALGLLFIFKDKESVLAQTHDGLIGEIKTHPALLGGFYNAGELEDLVGGNS